jgi:hypothetical protein
MGAKRVTISDLGWEPESVMKSGSGRFIYGHSVKWNHVFCFTEHPDIDGAREIMRYWSWKED